MPRSVSEILAHAEELADRFEAFDPSAAEGRDASALANLRAAVIARGTAERAVMAAVAEARRAGQSWTAIGAMIGTSGEAARQRYRDADQAASELPEARAGSSPKA